MTRDPKKLRPHPITAALPRWPDESDEFRSMVESIRDHGVMESLIITDDDQVMDGETRRLAAIAAGVEIVPVVIRPEAECLYICSHSEIERRHLNKGQLAFKYVPIFLSQFKNRRERKCDEINGSRCGSSVGNNFPTKSTLMTLEEFIVASNISLRYWNLAHELYTLLETMTTPRAWTSADAVEALKRRGTPGAELSPKAYFTHRILLDTVDPINISDALRGVKALLDQDAKGTPHRGRASLDSDDQLSLFRRVGHDLSHRWEYWENFDAGQRKAALQPIKTALEKAPLDAVEHIYRMAKSAYDAKRAESKN